MHLHLLAFQLAGDADYGNDHIGFPGGGHGLVRGRRLFTEKLRAGHVIDSGAWKFVAQAFEHRDGVRGNAVIVAQQDLHLIGQRTDDGDFDARGF